MDEMVRTGLKALVRMGHSLTAVADIDKNSPIQAALDYLEEVAQVAPSAAPAYRFCWNGNKAWLDPIDDFAAFDLDWLVGIEKHLALIDANTRNMLDGYPALNTLIWGPRGGGKSSIIRGLICRYQKQGLGGIEIPSNTYEGLYHLYGLVRRLPGYYIAVLDNISLSRDEAAFRHLSSAIEGTLERKPDNLVFYATSNYKDLVDRRGERVEGLGRLQLDADFIEPNLVNQGKRPEKYDPQANERQDEQRAFDDRFALKVFINLPNKKEYEHILLDYAKRLEIQETPEELLAAFKIWCMRHNHDLIGGRTARDFIVARYPQQAADMLKLHLTQ
jgi:uncharacterized protein